MNNYKSSHKDNDIIKMACKVCFDDNLIKKSSIIDLFKRIDIFLDISGKFNKEIKFPKVISDKRIEI